jgi:hypothetical protein
MVIMFLRSMRLGESRKLSARYPCASFMGVRKYGGRVLLSIIVSTPKFAVPTVKAAQ